MSKNLSFLHCWIKHPHWLHVLVVNRQWHLGWHIRGSQHPLSHKCSHSSCPARMDGRCLQQGCGSRLTRDKGKQLSNEFSSEPYTLGHVHHLLLTQDNSRLSITEHLQFLPCVSVNLFLFFNSSFGDFHFLILTYSGILTVFQLHKNQLRIFALLVLYGHDLILESIGEGKY